MTKTVEEIRAAMAAGEKVTKAEAQRVADHDQSQREQPTVDPVALREAQFTAMHAIASALHEPQWKVRGDNGRLYPIDAQLPGDVQPEAEEQVERFAYLLKDQLSVLCWKAESALEKNVEQQGRIKGDISREMRSVSPREEFIASKMDYLEELQTQEAILGIMADARFEAYVEIVGEDYETKAMKAQAAVARAATGRMTARQNPLAARAKALGVPLG